MTKRPMTDEELDAYIDALNEREAAQSHVDTSVTIISVHGRIGNVRWLETEFHATKQRNGKYFEYEVSMPADDSRTFDLIRRLQDAQESGSGIWFESH